MNIFIIILSVAILLLSSVIAVFSHKIFPKGSKIKPIYVLLTGAFLAVFVVMLSIDYKPELHGPHATFFLALIHTLQILLLGYEFNFLYDAIFITDAYATFSYFYFSFLFFLAPIYTFGFVLSFFESITAYLQFFFRRKADIYILSDISDKALAMAASIRKEYPKALIVFTTTKENADKSSDYMEERKEIKAMLFQKDMADIRLKFRHPHSKAVFIAIHEDESVNLEVSLCLIHKYNTRPHTELYLLSTSQEGAILIDSAEIGAMKVRRINETRSFAYMMLHTHPITDHITVQDDKKIISTLIVGFGKYGSELTKALLWCGQLPDYHTEITVIDQKNASASFCATCPEIMLLNHNHTPGEAIYDLDFHDNVDIHSDKFCKIISSLSNTSVVYVCLGNDDLNIETAISLRILFARNNLYPVIRAILYSDIKHKILKNNTLVNYKGESYDIEIIGNIHERFSYRIIVNEELESMALTCHLRWANDPEAKEAAIRQFNEYEYFRNSSIATALHESYRKKLSLPEDIAAVAEHSRWNAYMRTEGFVYAGSPDKSARNDRAKMHNNLHRFGLLSEDEIDKDRRMVQKKS